MSIENDMTMMTMMTMIKKNPVVTCLVVVVAILVVVVIIMFVKIRQIVNGNGDGDNNNNSNTPKPTPITPITPIKEEFSSSNDESIQIIENYPQTTPMNIMYSDANGNLAATSDLGLQNLTVNSDSSFGGNVGIAGSSKIGGFVDTPSLNRNDGDWLRINNQGASVGQTAMYGGVCINDTKQTHGGLSVGDWNSNVGQGNIHATGRVFSDKNLQTIRNRVCFSNALDDPNHSIYNNGWNIDGQGAWDGMKMNVYAGLDVRTGNANGAVPTTRLSIRDNGTLITSDSSPAGNGFEYRHSNMSQGIGLGYNTIYATGSNANQDLNINSRGNLPVRINGVDILDELNKLKSQVNNCIPNGQKVQFRSYDVNRWLSEINGGAEVRGHRGVWSQFNIFKT